ncbi:WD40 repeat-like protein [Armillaria gallica]|uniref:WD40 repeat-like protein n=1 Tax=Armillaria gallica TaxID=47427 RepID=A0A2H3D5I4_ARMGA|nr:WD40 repeat-like protein [Armillaria gallica]
MVVSSLPRTAIPFMYIALRLAIYFDPLTGIKEASGRWPQLRILSHVFGGYTSTVRCLTIVKPGWVDVEQESRVATKEKWPKRSVIVTGSKDHSLRVWTLPKPGEAEYHCYGSEDADLDSEDVCDAEENPYHRLHLEGHEQAVRALAARGRTLVSGSYDCNVRVWDIITGECRSVLTGHTQKGSCIYGRNSSRVESTDRTMPTYLDRTYFAGRSLGLLPSYLISGAADAALRIWDLDTGELKHTLVAHTGAITCFQHDEFKVLSGSDGALKLWDIHDGTVVKDLLTGITSVWQVVFEGRWCVSASDKNGTTVLDVWDFGDPDIDRSPKRSYNDDFSDDEDEHGEVGFVPP